MRTLTNEQFIEAVKNSISISETLKALNIRTTNYRLFHSTAKELNVSTIHFLGQKHMKGKTNDVRKIKLSEILIKNSTYGSHKLKLRLIKEGVFKNQCSICNILLWQGKQLSLHLDHINGIHIDNTITNIRLLCPNCHSQT